MKEVAWAVPLREYESLQQAFFRIHTGASFEGADFGARSTSRIIFPNGATVSLVRGLHECSIEGCSTRAAIRLIELGESAGGRWEVCGGKELLTGDHPLEVPGGEIILRFLRPEDEDHPPKRVPYGLLWGAETNVGRGSEYGGMQTMVDVLTRLRASEETISDALTEMTARAEAFWGAFGRDYHRPPRHGLIRGFHTEKGTTLFFGGRQAPHPFFLEHEGWVGHEIAALVFGEGAINPETQAHLTWWRGHRAEELFFNAPIPA